MRAALFAFVLAVASVGAGASATAGTTTASAEPMLGPAKSEVAGAYWRRYHVIAVGGGFVESRDSTADLLLFDTEAQRWSRGPDLPSRRDHAALAALGGDLYLVGGFTTGLSGATAEAWRLDSPRSTWIPVASMGTPRGALGVAAVDGRLVAVGGVDGAGHDLRTTEWYDARRDQWHRGPDLSRTRQHVGVTARGRTVYAVGGRDPNLDTVERLRFRDGKPRGQWSAAPSLEFSRSGNGAATVDGTVCTAGGEESSGTIAPIECLLGGRWQHVADMAVPRHGLAVVAVGHELHTIAGGPQPGFAFSVDHEVLDVRRISLRE